MNELQQVLLIFAAVVIVALYFLSRSRQSALKKEQSNQTKSGKDSENDAYQKASHALNELGEPHIPVSNVTEARIAKEIAKEESVKTAENLPELETNEQQGSLPFGEEFSAPKMQVEKGNIELPEQAMNTSQEEVTSVVVEQPQEVQNQETQMMGENDQGGKHHVLVADEISVSAKGNPYEKPSFGIPEELDSPKKESSVFKKEPQTFVILVMSTGQEFSMFEVNQALLGVGLTFMDSKIYVKQDNMGGEILKVANLMEPGTFAVDDLQSNKASNRKNNSTCGVALILALPTTVKAPAAMHDLIMMARKISQRLQGRLYNMERQLLKESDLQKMRDVAVKYESEPLGQD